MMSFHNNPVGSSFIQTAAPMLSIIAAAIFQDRTLLTVPPTYSVTLGNCISTMINSAANVPITAPDGPNLGIRIAFKITSATAPETTEYSTILSLPWGSGSDFP